MRKKKWAVMILLVFFLFTNNRKVFSDLNINIDCSLTPPKITDGFIAPVKPVKSEAWTITNNFAQVHENFPQQGCWQHTGEDYLLSGSSIKSAEKEVFSVANGIVVFSTNGDTNPSPKRGGLVIIKHLLSTDQNYHVPSFNGSFTDGSCSATSQSLGFETGEVLSYYLHLGEIYVKKGDPVSRGSLIGKIYKYEEYSSGKYIYVPHLHFEIWKNCTPIEPNGYDQAGLEFQNHLESLLIEPSSFIESNKFIPTRFMDFEDGTDGAIIRSKIPGMTFITTAGYDWIYGDWRTGKYNGPYPNGAYVSNGNFFAWLGPSQSTGRINFTGATANYLSVLTSTYSGLTIDAYDTNGELLASSGWATNNLWTGKMTKLTVSAPGMAYVLIHDTGNYWLIDDLEIGDLLADTKANLPAGFTAKFETLETINQSQSKWERFFNDVFQTLRIILGWGGSELSLRIYRPDGSLYNEYQSNTPPIETDIPNAEPGEWQFEITAIDVPYDNYPFALVIGVQPNLPPIALCKDIIVNAGTNCQANASIDNGSYDPDGDSMTITQNPAGPYNFGSTVVTLIVTDSSGASNNCTGTVAVVDATAPTVAVKTPQTNTAYQDGIKLTAEAMDACVLAGVYFSIREPDGLNGIPIGYENLPAIFNSSTGQWEYNLNTTLLPDGYYIILAKAIDSNSNEGWSVPVPFSIRNWAVIQLLPATASSKAGRTMPIKFSLRIVSSVDPAQPFVYNDDLEIRIYDKIYPNVILQTCLCGNGSRDYRIDTVVQKYIANFQTKKLPAEYVVEIWRINKNWLVGSFSFKTIK